MIGKIFHRGAFTPVLRYITSKEGTERIGGNMAGDSIPKLVAEFERSRELNLDVSKPTCHIALSCPHQEHLDQFTWRKFAKDYLHQMGFKECQWVAYRHVDCEHDHIHIVVSRIRITDGKTVSDAWSHYRNQEVLRGLEQQYGLLEVETSWAASHKALSQRERKQLDQTGIPSVRQQLQDCLGAIAQNCSTFSEFIGEVQAVGIGIQASVTPSEDVGLSYEWNGVALPASKLGKNYTFKGLVKRLGISYDPERDNEVLGSILIEKSPQKQQFQQSPIQQFTEIAARYLDQAHQAGQVVHQPSSEIQADLSSYQPALREEPIPQGSLS